MAIHPAGREIYPSKYLVGTVLHDHELDLIPISRQVEPVRVPDIYSVVRHALCAPCLQAKPQKKAGDRAGKCALDQPAVNPDYSFLPFATKF